MMKQNVLMSKSKDISRLGCQLFFMVFLVVACAKKGSGGDPAADQTPPEETILSGKLNFGLAVPKSDIKSPGMGLERQDWSEWLSPGLGLLDATLTPFKNVYAAGSGLESFKIFVTEISICDKVGGSPDGCLIVYKGPKPPADLLNTADRGAALGAALSTTDGYIDVMSETGRQLLAKSIALSDADARKYVWGKVEFAKPVKVKASLVDPLDGTTAVLYTKATEKGSCQVNNNPVYVCALTIGQSLLTAAPPEEATFIGSNSMSFAFQQPFEITAEDIAQKTNFELKIAFNPHGVIQGVLADSANGGATNYPPMTDNSLHNGYNLGNTIAMVGGQMAPVFFKSGDTVMRETYMARIKANGNNNYYDYRIEFYYLKSDENRSIYGVNTATIPNANTKGYLLGTYAITKIDTGVDGSLNLLDENGDAQIRGLQRLTAIGASSSAKIKCDIVAMNCTAGQDVDITLTLTALDELP